jgi:dynein heavy chain 2
LKAWNDTAEFKLMEHTSNATGRKTMLIREWKELFTQVGDNQSLLSSLKDSPYFKPFADTASIFETNFTLLDECCQRLNAIQRRWVYLEPVFSRGALPSEQGRFKRVDEEFHDIMGKIAADPRATCLTDATAFPNLKDTLSNISDQLERCQRALSEFLGELRAPA